MFGQKRRKQLIKQMAEFEAKYGIVLPESYRNHMIEAGEKACFMALEDFFSWEDGPDDFLRQPFPHAREWNNTSLINKGVGWDAEYYHDRHRMGSMRIVITGCEGYLLMVVTGPERGNIWSDQRVPFMEGIYPLKYLCYDRLTIDQCVEIFRAEGIKGQEKAKLWFWQLMKESKKS